MIPFQNSGAQRLVKRSRSMADQIYEMLTKGIIKGEIKPGYRLYEVEVAKDFDVSRTPVREAFRRLEQDSLAERVAQGGIRVIQLDEQTVCDLFKLRAILETHSIELACERITGEEIAILKQIRAQANELLSSTEADQDFTLNLLFELNTAFHDTIYNATDNKFLIKLLVNIRAVILSMRQISIRLDSVRQVWDEHSAIIDQLECRNKERAVHLITEHISKTADQVLAFIRLQGSETREDSGISRAKKK